MADKYADVKYLNDPSTSIAAPTGPIAVPKLVRGDDGLMRTVYVDPKTGDTVNNLNGYTVVTADGGVYKVTESDDENKDGTVDQLETQKGAYSALGLTDRGHTTREDALGHTPGPKATESNNFGYHSKPGFLGPAAMIAGVVNPGIGAGLGMLGRAFNVGNMEAVNDARKMLGLSSLTGKEMAKGAMKDNKGQIARVEMGNNQKYSIGFEAMDANNRTNLTPSEAAKRATMFGMQETPDDAPKSTVGKLGSKISKAIGIEPGFVTKALNSIVGTPNLPDQAPAPTARPTARPEDMGTVAPGASNKTKTSVTNTAPAAGLISHPNNPAVSASNPNTARNPDDSLGRVTIDKVDFGKIGLNPAMAAKMKDFQKQAIDQGLGKKLSVDVSNTKRTPEQQAAIQEAGFSKTKTSYHNVGLAVDVSPTAVDDQGRIIDQATLEKSRALAKQFGFSLLDPSWDPAHIQQNVPGETAKSLSKREVDAFGNTKLSPEEDLGIRDNSVPTPTSKPDVASTGFVSQDERNTNTGGVKNAASVRSQLGLGQVPDNVGAPSVNQTAPEVDRNYAGQGLSPSKSFVSQDEKANTGNIANAAPANNFVSQDERSSLAERTGITPAALDPVGNSLSPTANNSKVTGPVSAQASVGAKTVANAVQSTNAKLGTTPAAMAAMGLTNRTAQEKAAMAKAIAGELSQASLAGVKAKDPKALAEMGSMLATMENRAASKKYDSMGKVLGPTQYNSLMASNMAVTNQNYAANKKAIDAATKAFYSGKLPGVNYNATNYYNPDVADPAWGAKMANQTTLGAHKFGSLPEYGPNQAAKDAAKAMGIMAGTDFSPGKAADDNVGYSGTGSSFGGSAGQSAGAGYSPGGMNSPSGSSSSSGWQGGGNNGNGTNWGGNGGGNFGGSPSPSSGGNNGGLGGPTSNNSGNSGSVSSAGKSPSSSGNMGGLGGPTSNNSGNSGKSGGMNSSGSSAGAQSRSDGWN